MIDIRDHGAQEGVDCSAILQALVDTADEPIWIPKGDWIADGVFIQRSVRIVGGGQGSDAAEGAKVSGGKTIFEIDRGMTAYPGNYVIEGINLDITKRTGTTTCTAAIGDRTIAFADAIFAPLDIVLIRGAGIEGADLATQIQANGLLNEPIRTAVTDAACEFYDCAVYTKVAGAVRDVRITGTGHGVFEHGGTDIPGRFQPVTNVNAFEATGLEGARIPGTTLRIQGNNANSGRVIGLNVYGGGANDYCLVDACMLGNHYIGWHLQGPKEAQIVGPLNGADIPAGYSEHAAHAFGPGVYVRGSNMGEPGQTSGCYSVASQGTIYQSKTLFHGANFKVSIGELPSKPIRVDFAGQGGTWDWAYGRSTQGHGEPGWMGWYKGNSPRNAAILENEAGEPLLVRGGYWIAKVPGSLVEGNRLWRGVGTGPPTGPSRRSNGLWMPGDKIENSNPGPFATAYWLCIGQGNPGTWEARQ